ncbi:membrane protein [Rodentibacter pneumotropicus]|uniref:Membrane protein n=1 Tax=Rodentibacter pneumotropicus TaxID=758 RepID=A0A3S4XVB1_9PAST|nr:membrane protein [Rodentibacter pneumotropicus]
MNADGQGLTWEKFTQNFQVKGDVPIWPLLFLTISCGALSGFHATQTPLMARCAENESEGRFIFYGAMITEGIIALVWCMVGLAFYEIHKHCKMQFRPVLRLKWCMTVHYTS